MKLLVISPEGKDAREPAVVGAFLAAGLCHYHLRKPAWSREQTAAWLRRLPAELHPRIVLHSHHDLAGEFAVGGLHDRDEGEIRPFASAPGILRSRACHDSASLRAASETYDRILFSPVFSSFSKPGRVPSPGVSPAELQSFLALPRRPEVIALGGVDATRLAECRDLGFDGVAVLGAIWQAADPVKVFHELQQALPLHAA